MSWQDDLNNNIFTIITGDGARFTPKWRNAVKDLEFNASVYEFIDVEGSLVLRKKPKGRRFELEFYFDGEDAVTDGNAFELSARDPRFWTVKHPFYGDIECQPLSLKQDNKDYNTSKFNVIVVETITKPQPSATVNVADVINDSLAEVNESQAVALSNAAELDRVEMEEQINLIDKIYSANITVNEEFREYKKAVAEAVREVQNNSATILSVLRTVQNVINFPATITQTVEARANAIKEAFNTILDNFRGNKNQTEAMAGGLVSALAVAVSSEPDYVTRAEVLNQQAGLTDTYSAYSLFLDGQQTERADSDDSYIPAFDSQRELKYLVSLSASNLYEIAFEAKQERSYVLTEDSNPVILTHRFYGLDADDENLNYFIGTNNIGLNELLGLRKGREVLYYV